VIATQQKFVGGFVTDLLLLSDLNIRVDAVHEARDDDALGDAGAEQQSAAEKFPLVHVQIGIFGEDAASVT
jgi:hypothetical protein